MVQKHGRTRLAMLACLAGVIGSMASAQVQTGAAGGYKAAPPAIAKILEHAPLPGVSLSPGRDYMLLVDRISLPPVSDLAQPLLKLAGSRINPSTNAPYGPRRYTGLTLKKLSDGSDQRVELVGLKDAEELDLGFPSWSHDNARFMFTVTRDGGVGVELWVGEVATGKARALTGPILNTASGGAMRWMPDGKTILCKLVPSARGKAPERPLTPVGPVVQESIGKTAQVRTYQDLLKDPHDENLFDYYMTAQAAMIDSTSGKRTDIGKPAVFSTLDPSPSGEYLLVGRTHRPYSFQVPEGLFPETMEVWDAKGGLVKTLAEYPLREEIPIEGVQTGPREYEWRDTAPATLTWAEALDNGDPKNKVPQRDKVLMQAAPFKDEAKELIKTEHRFSGISWAEKSEGVAGYGGLCMYAEYDRDKRWTRSWMLDVDTPGATPVKVFDRSVNDRYNNPGSPLSKRSASGRSVIRVHGNSLYLVGAGSTPEGDLPFLDRMPLDTLKPQRLWRSEKGGYETVIDLLADDGSSFMTSFEQPNTPPNYYICGVSRDKASNPVVLDRVAVTTFPDPAPELRAIKKELVKYKRADGVELSATMYLPPGFDPEKVKRGEAKPLPLFLWAYPMEFNDAATAGQVSGSTSRFTIFGGISHLFLLTQGYAVMDNATMPIVGDPETMNDTFVEQIVAAAQAAIDKAVDMGVADRDRVAVGGHSYGAFMTANLLAHCDLFRAGIARSGAYNRTLTPFGFQGERRTYWEAVDTYTKLSPFTFANKIKAPLLMIHGQNDSNPGTFPIQSERLFAAIKGTGGTVRLVLLPFEDHGYSAKESVFQVQAEMTEWLDKYVKNAPARTVPAGSAPEPKSAK